LSRSPRPTPEDLRILDPDGSFRLRLAADRAGIAAHHETDNTAGLQRLVHGLAGAAGTFGFDAIGDIAVELDDHFAAGRPVSALDVARLLAALDGALAKL
jgi:HPt (histidine-containing phosphotransfer) domain-containing protein